MTAESLAKFIAETLDSGAADDALRAWVNAYVDYDPSCVWIELSDAETDGAAGQTFRLTIEPQP